MAGRLRAMICTIPVASLAGVVGFAHGQSDATLADPTRPPASVSEPVSAGTPNVTPMSGLQTIIAGRGRKPMALINGMMVGLGDKLGEATLVKINESEVVLLGPAGREVLQLLPGVAKNTSDPGGKNDQGKTYGK